MMFTGYSEETQDFLWGIRFNNDREWFAAHKEAYLTHVYQPTLALGGEVYDRFTEKFPELGLNLHVSRIYRDARRLHGRGPYKDHLWFSLRGEGEEWHRRPVFWFEVGPEGWSHGLGCWMAAPSAMAAMRRSIDQDPAAAAKLARRLRKRPEFQLDGEDYARPKGDPGKLLAPWYNKKTFSISSQHPFDELLCSPELAERLVEDYAFLKPCYDWFSGFCTAGLEDLR